MMVESGQLVAHSLPLDLTADVVHAGRAEHLQQQHAQAVAHLWQGQGRRQLLTPVGFTDQEPDRHQGQRHVMMPALPGPHLVGVHPHLTFATSETGFNAGSCPYRLRLNAPGSPIDYYRTKKVYIRGLSWPHD